MKEQIKQLRVEIDGLAQLCEGLKPIKDIVAIHKVIGHLGTIPVYGTTEQELKERQVKFQEEYDKVDAATSKNSEEIKEAVRSLKLSKAWLGKVLGSLGSDNPYGSGYKTIEDIVPETDKAKTVCGVMGIDGETPRLEAVDTFTLNGKIMNEYSQMSHIEKVDWLRTEIKRLGIQLYDTIHFKEIGISEGELAYKYICEARFWLGFEMGRIRDESK